MRHGDDQIRALGARGVHGVLHAGVQRRAGFILLEAVDEFAGFILEILRRGRGDRLRRADADEGDFQSVEILDYVRVEHGFADAQIREIAADVREVRLRAQRKELIHAIVELMVAGHGDAVADFVHDIGKIFAVGQRADRGALHGVARIDKHDLQPFRPELFGVRGKAGIAEVVVNAAMDVVGEEQDDVRAFRRGKAEAGQEQTAGDEQRKQLLHVGVLLFSR